MMKLRSFAEEDREFYVSASKEFYSSAAVAHRVPESNFKETFSRCVAGDPNVKGYVIEVGGAAAGFVLLSFYYSNEVAGNVVLLEEIYIRQEFRGKGFATQVIKRLEVEYLHTGKARRMRLEVTPENPRAIALYRRLGFSEMGYIQMKKDK